MRRLCLVAGCEGPSVARDLCGAHYARLRNRSPLGGPIRHSELLVDEPYAACPDGCIDLAADVAEIDSQVCFRWLWQQIGAGHLRERIEANGD